MIHQKNNPQNRETLGAKATIFDNRDCTAKPQALLPYSRQILNARKRGEHPFHGTLFCNFGWPNCPPRQWCFCLPTNVQIESLDCAFCAGLDVLIFAKGYVENRAYQFASHLQQFSVDKILISFGEGFFRYAGGGQ